MRWHRLLVLALIVPAFNLQGFGQSLADAARKERERQRTARSKVVVTGTGTSSTSITAPAAAPSTAATPPATASQTPKPGEVTDNKGRNEQFWRSAFQKARDDARRAETTANLLDLKLKELNTALLQQTDIYNRENRIGAEITATQKAIDDARRAVEQAKKNIADLEEELRRSGGPAGWAR